MSVMPLKVSTEALAEYIIMGAGEDEYEREAGQRMLMLDRALDLACETAMYTRERYEREAAERDVEE